MGLCYNIVFIFSFEYLYPKEASISAICEIISNKEETEYCDKYIVRVSEAKFYNEIYKDKINVENRKFEKLSYIKNIQNNNQKESKKINFKNMINTKIILYVSKGENYFPGDIIFIDGKFEKGEISRNYKGFSYRNYLKTKKIYGIVNTESIVKIKHKIDSYSIFGKMQYNLKRKIDYLYSNENASFLKSILLGDTSVLDEDIKDNFRDSSISHILAISGLHVTYVVLGMNFLLEKIIKNKNIRNYILIFLLLIFVILTGFSASCIRACIMNSMCLISFNIKRKNNFYITLGLSFFIIIIINPFSIFNIGMWLSFAGTLGIVLFSNFFNRILEIKLKVKLSKNKIINVKKDNKNKIILEMLKEQTNSLEKLCFKCNVLLIVKYIKEKIFRILLSIFSVSVSTQILIFPIIIYSFNTFSLNFFILNILISIFIGPILILGYVTVFISFLFLPATKFLAMIESELIYVVFQIARDCANLPFSKIYVTTPNFIEIIIYYLLVFIIVYLVRIKRFYMIKLLLSYRFLKSEIYSVLVNIKKEINIESLKYRLNNQKKLSKLDSKSKKIHKNEITNRSNNILKKFIIIILIILIVINFINFDSSLKIYFVDVGQGDCTVISTPKGKNIIIDGGEGNSDKYDAGENIVLPYLLDRKINKIDYLIVSHR